MENGAVVVADSPRGEAGRESKAVRHPVLVIYVFRLLLLFLCCLGVGVRAVWTVRFGLCW